VGEPDQLRDLPGGVMSRLPGHPLGRALAAALLAIVVAGAQAAPALAAGPIAVDGQFGDWEGQACLGDSATDDSSPATNIVRFCWGTNAGDPTLYFELVRVTPQINANPVVYRIYVDTNNNGRYTDATDRQVMVEYQPKNNGTSTVQVTVLDAGGSALGSASGDWGDSFEEGATRCEAGAGFAALGITAGTPIRFYVTASSTKGAAVEDRVPDNGDVQTAPVPILGLGWLLPPLAALAAGAALWSRARRAGWR